MSQFNTSDGFDVPSNATSVTAKIRLTKDGTTVERTATQVVPTTGDGPQVLELGGSLSDLKAQIDATPNTVGSLCEIDLGGKCYALLPDGHPSATIGDYNPDGSKIWENLGYDNRIIKLTNGYISFYEELIPTPSADGTYVTMPNNNTENILMVFDPSRRMDLPGVTDPAARLAVYPPQLNDLTYSFLPDKNSFDLDTDAEFPKGELVIGGPNNKVIGMKVTDADLVQEIKDMLELIIEDPRDAATTRTEAAVGIGMIVNRSPNQLAFGNIGTYQEEGDGSILIIWSNLELANTSSQYISEFLFFGRLTFLSLGNQQHPMYAYNETEIVYKPSPGAPLPTQLFVPHVFADENGRWTEHNLFGNGTVHLDNISLIGSGKVQGNSRSDNMVCVVSPHGPEVSTVNNCRFYLGGLAIAAGGGNNFVITNTGFYGHYAKTLGGSAEDGYIIDRCEFIGGNYKSSAIARSNYTLAGGAWRNDFTIQPLVVTNSYMSFYSNHGQGISAYAGSYINTRIENNIFYNLNRVLSFQWISNFDLKYVNDLAEFPGLKFNNNYVVTDRPPNQVTSQATIAHNGSTPTTTGMVVDSNASAGWTENLLPLGRRVRNETTIYYDYNFLREKISTQDQGSIWKYQIRFKDGTLSNILFTPQSPAVDELGPVNQDDGSIVEGHILRFHLGAERRDFVPDEKNVATSYDEIYARGEAIGEPENEYLGTIEYFTPAHIDSEGNAVDEVVHAELEVTDSYVHKNFPPIEFLNNTVTFTQRFIDLSNITTDSGGWESIAETSTGRFDISGGTSGMGLQCGNLGPIICRNNIGMGITALKTTRKPRAIGGWDPFTTPRFAVQLAADFDGVYGPDELVAARLEGFSDVFNNVFVEALGTGAEGLLGFDNYPDQDPNRENLWSIAIPGSPGSAFKSGKVRYDLWNGFFLNGGLFDWNDGDAEVFPTFGTDLGIQLETYPTWNDLENLRMNWTDIYRPVPLP